MTPPRAFGAIAAAAVLLGGCGGSTERSTAPAAGAAAVPTRTADPPRSAGTWRRSSPASARR